MKYQSRTEVPSGETKTIVMPNIVKPRLPVNVQLNPGSGGTLSAWVSCDDKRFIETQPELVSWTALNPASVSESAIIVIDMPISAIKVMATTADGVVNVLS